MFLIDRVRIEDDLPRLEAREVHSDHLAKDGDRIARYSTADDEIETARLAGGCRLEDVIGDLVAINGVSAKSGRERKVDSAEDDASQFRSLSGCICHGFKLSE